MKTILIVDDEPNNLQLLRMVLKGHYSLMFANNGAKCLEIAEQRQPDLILLDVMMPGLTGYEVCQKLMKMPSTKNIPVIFVTAMGEAKSEAKGFDAGAVDYISKPISAAIVLRRVKTHLSLVRVKELEESRKSAIHMLGQAGHLNDTDTGVHIWRMAAYSKAIALATGWSIARAERLELAAPMHDTGKIGIPDGLLKAKRKLTPEEWEIMRTHPVIGYDILSLSPSKIFKLAAEVSLYHHERWDGSGYPEGLTGEEIPQSARIVAIADVFDALTMKRPYKESWTIEESMSEIKKGSGSHFDPKLVELFISISPIIVEIKKHWDDSNSWTSKPEN
jgi:putative two-component system response regulator